VDGEVRGSETRDSESKPALSLDQMTQRDKEALVGRGQVRRQRIRKAVMLISLLLFPVVLNYLSPYVIIDGAMQGIVNGSLVVFALLFLSSLFFGRLWCAWLCSAGGLQETCFAISEERARGGRLNWIKWGVWIPWMATIGAMAISAGGYRAVNVFHLTDSGISVDRPEGYIVYYFVVGVILILSLTTGKRAFCHYGCWMAPFMVIGRKIRNVMQWPALRLKADTSTCIGCKRCTRNCPMSPEVHQMVQEGVMEHSECILCATCVDNCPKGVIAYSLSAGG